MLAVEVDEEQNANADAPAATNRDLCRNVGGSPECLRTWKSWSVVLYCFVIQEKYLPMMFPTQYPIKYIAATVVFFV